MDTKRIAIFSVMAIYSLAIIWVLVALVFEYISFDAYQNPKVSSIVLIISQLLKEKIWLAAFIGIIGGVLGSGGGWFLLTSPRWVRAAIVILILLVVTLSLVDAALIMMASDTLRQTVFAPPASPFDVALGIATIANTLTTALLAGFGFRIHELHTHPDSPRGRDDSPEAGRKRRAQAV